MHEPFKQVERCNKLSYDKFQEGAGNIKKKRLLLMQWGWLGGDLFGKAELLWKKSLSREKVGFSLG